MNKHMASYSSGPPVQTVYTGSQREFSMKKQPNNGDVVWRVDHSSPLRLLSYPGSCISKKNGKESMPVHL
jgi:hypothetical protein